MPVCLKFPCAHQSEVTLMLTQTENFTVSEVALAYYKKVRANYSMPIDNRPYYGLTLIGSGALRLVFDDKEYVAQKGDIILQRKGDTYRLETDEATEYIVISYLCESDEFEKMLPEGRIFHPKHQNRYADAFERASSIHFSQGMCYEPLLRAVVQELLCNIVREGCPKALTSANNPLMAAKYYIEEFSNHFITADDIASVAGCSQSHLRYLFRQTYGESPMHYLNRVRIERAKEMISANMLSLSEIATACGFRNVYYFSKVFKEFTGISPGQY